MFVPAIPLSTVEIDSLATSDTAIIPHYTVPPRNWSWEPSIAAGVTQLKQHQNSFAISTSQRSGSRIITTRRDALVRCLRHHQIFECFPS